MNIQSLHESEWNEMAKPYALCTVKFDALLFREKFGLEPLVYNEDGLSTCTAFLFKRENSKYWVRSFLDYEDQRPFIFVDVPSYEANSQIAFERLVQVLKLESVDWLNETLGPANWVLSRVDDNGNEIEMQRFLEESSAKYVQGRYEKLGHKQAYYVHKRR